MPRGSTGSSAVVTATTTQMSLWVTQLAAGVITASQFQVFSATLLGTGPVVVPPSVTSVSSLEDHGTRSRRETKQVIEGWIGKGGAPKVDGELWEVVMLGAGSDEILRNKVAVIREGLLARALLDLFFAAGKGVTPPFCVGTTSEANICRLASRELLRNLASHMAAAMVVSRGSEASRQQTQLDLYALLDDNEIANNVVVFTTAINKLHGAAVVMPKSATVSTANVETVAKRHREGSDLRDGTCFVCHQRGHLAATCKNRVRAPKTTSKK